MSSRSSVAANTLKARKMAAAEENRMSGGIVALEWRYNEAPKDPNDTVADNLIRDILRSCNITPEERDRGIMFDWRRCDVIERGRRYEAMKRR